MKQTAESNRKRSIALKGLPKSLETRAAMSASRMVDRLVNPILWRRFYVARLMELRQIYGLLDNLQNSA